MPGPADEYVNRVREEIKTLRGYFNRQLRSYRAIRAVAIVSASLVPVLATWSEFPRLGLAALGAVVALAEVFQGLFQLRKSALNAMKTTNTLERQLNKYLTGVDPYGGTQQEAFTRFARQIEAIRESADQAFFEMWQEAGAIPERPQGQQVATTESGPPTKAVGPSSAAGSP